MSKSSVLLATCVGVCLLLGGAAQAQDSLAIGNSYPSEKKSFGLTLGAGVATTYRYGFNWFDANGLVLSVEPTYQVSPRLTLGLKGELALIKTYLVGGEKNKTRVDAPASVAFLLGGNYTLGNQEAKLKPYVGAGLGLYGLGKGTVVSSNKSVDLGTRFGVALRVGLQGRTSGLALEANRIDEKDNVNNRDYISLKYTYRFQGKSN